MLINKYIACQTCNEKINIRIQSEDNRIPFIVNCPKCSTEISVEIDLSKNGELTVANASEFQKIPDSPLWCVDLSASFPVRKMYRRDPNTLNYVFGPYIATQMLLEKDEHDIFMAVMNQLGVLNQKTQMGLFEDFLRINNLLSNDNEKYFLEETQKLLHNISAYTPISKVNNILDGVMVLHQSLLSSGITVLLEDGALGEYKEISRSMINVTSDSKRKQLLQLLKYYGRYEKTINQLEKRSYLLVRDFSKVFPQLSSVVLLMKTNKYNEIDKEEYGITNAIYRDLKQLYASSYEWLLDALDVVIALNNIFERQDYSKCLKNKDFNSDLQTINSKFLKIDMFISDDEIFSKPLTNINNRVRNAIQHYGDEIDYVSQKISFYDKYKGKTRVEEIYLMDFAKLCVENFAWIIYIMELIYNLKKIDLILVKAFEPSIKLWD